MNKNVVLDHLNQLHLCPLPHKVPCKAFKNTVVTFTCVLDPIDKYVVQKLCQLYDIREFFQEAVTDFVIVFTES